MSSTVEKSQGQWETILTRFGADAASLDGKHHPCPSCGGTDRFRFDDKDGSGSHICSQCGAGDGFELVKKMGDYADFKAAAKAIDDVMGWSGKSLSAADKQTYRDKMEKLRIEREEAEKEAHRIAANKAVAIWKGTGIAEHHPYLEAKGVRAHGLHVDGKGNLIVPVRINGEITSIQYINKHGGKFFLTDGNVSGGYYSIQGDKRASMDRAICSEGCATGASIREATGQHIAIAFNAGNLTKVAKVIREKLPNSQIIIAADNDKKTDNNTGLNAAIEAAQAVGGLIALPAGKEGSSVDWNDVHAEHGLEVVAAGIANAVSPEILAETNLETAGVGEESSGCDLEWGDPESFNTISYPELPCENDMPPSVWRIVEYAARLASTNSAFSFTSALSVIACVIRGRGYVARKDATIRNLLTVYVMNAALSGEGKTATRGIVSKPLDDIVEALKKEYCDSLREWKLRASVAKKSIAASEKLAVSEERTFTELEITLNKERLSIIESKPSQGLVVYTSSTPEALIEKSASSGFMCLATDEGSSVVESFGQYSNAKGSDLSAFLKGYDGSKDIAARRGDNSYGGEVKVALDLSVQPSVLKRVVCDSELISRGFVNRFFMLQTPTTAGTLDYHHRAVSDSSIEKDWHNRINAIHQKIKGLPEDECFTLLLSNEADAMHSDYANAYQQRVKEGGDLESMKDLFNKRFPSMTLRYAGLYHLIEGREVNENISAKTMQYAINTSEVTAQHYISIVKAAGTVESNLAKSLLVKIVENGFDRVTIRDIQRKEYCGLCKVDKVKAVVNTLIKMGYLVEVKQPATNKRGRQPASVYLVHPCSLNFISQTSPTNPTQMPKIVLKSDKSGELALDGKVIRSDDCIEVSL